MYVKFYRPTLSVESLADNAAKNCDILKRRTSEFQILLCFAQKNVMHFIKRRHLNQEKWLKMRKPLCKSILNKELKS